MDKQKAKQVVFVFFVFFEEEEKDELTRLTRFRTKLAGLLGTKPARFRCTDSLKKVLSTFLRRTGDKK